MLEVNAVNLNLIEPIVLEYIAFKDNPNILC